MLQEIPRDGNYEIYKNITNRSTKPFKIEQNIGKFIRSLEETIQELKLK